MELIVKTLFLILPAYLANMAPVIFNKLGWLKVLAKPVDGGILLGGQTIFGNSKTWRGFFSGAIGGLVGVLLMLFLSKFNYFSDFLSLDLISYLVLGVIGGLGAIFGDLIKSFFKRRLGIVSGASWPVFDQVDFILGYWLFSYWLINPEAVIIILSLAITIILHPLINILAYLLKIKKVWW